MLAVMALESHGLTAATREVLVTGAAGGGSVAIAVLAKRGQHIVASTGRTDTHEYL
jgi:acrylyl-CoA reductase (NADPH)